jgi:hypothetical protein
LRSRRIERLAGAIVSAASSEVTRRASCPLLSGATLSYAPLRVLQPAFAATSIRATVA